MFAKKAASALLLASLLVPSIGHAAPAASGKSSVQPADLILQNGAVYTVDRNRNWAEAVVVKGDTIVFVGSTEDAKAYAGEKTKVVDLKGKMVLPGFIDSHTHASKTTGMIYTVDLFDLGSIEKYVEAVKQFAEKYPSEKAIQGRGWTNSAATGIGPRKEALDAISKDVPIALTSDDGHSLWVNSKALEIAGIGNDTPNPEGGLIERDPETGEASGTLREKAMDLVLKQIPGLSVEQYMNGILEYQKLAAERGVTTARDPDMLRYPNVLEAYQKLSEQDKLTVRFRNAFTADPEKGPEQVNDFIKLREANKGPHFQVNAVKIFMDGVVEGGTGYLEEPYKHKDTHGQLIWTPEAYKKTAAAADKAGFQLHVHSIGDAATRITLDGFEYAEKENGKRDARPSVVHLQLVNPKDIERFKKLGAVGIPQPYWFLKEPGFFEEIEVPYLGRERAEQEYPMKSLINAGVIMASGSDYIVTQEFNPLHGIQQGVTRIEEGKTDFKDIANPSERATLADMIASFTIDGAYSTYVEDITGSIEAGKRADLVVLDKNLFTIPASEINKTEILWTLFEGKEVYRSENFK
ncbi:amidohydrolase [Brevibacillus composti]|uniref:Amidohydrolase n=1 Tax=Brevibacillus composti TaxID=2796470 RepID=A0A7T5EHE5_9BACL|nr:amidohydrolase [Brevibacillus composti]QQE72623.1 amidohydrolase [Brevibacillus composti]QUO39700.1 amidohydrolase [Brevibacillus composti]